LEGKKNLHFVNVHVSTDSKRDTIVLFFCRRVWRSSKPALSRASSALARCSVSFRREDEEDVNFAANIFSSRLWTG
jgi:hypothetical protein